MSDRGRPDLPSLMFYCHDAYGVGHLARTLTLARYFRVHWTAATRLIVTGSAVPPSLPSWEDVDWVKLPSVVRTGADHDPAPWVARTLPIPFPEILDLRREMLLSIVHHFRPAALVVDNLPAGIGGEGLEGELVPVLRYLKNASPATRLVLGLRDIINEPALLRQTWTRDGAWELVDDVYDRIVIYGQPEVFDAVQEYGFSPRAAAKTRYVGYLRRQAARSAAEVRAELGVDGDRLVLVAAGGGVDGYPLLRTAIEAFAARPAAPRFDCVLVAGPLLGAGPRQSAKELAAGVPQVRLLDAVHDLASYIAAADVVVSMGGYNSICEILSFARPAVIVPRDTQSREQMLRAEILSRRGLIRMIPPSALSPARLLAEVIDLLEHPGPPPASLNFDGLPSMAAELRRLLIAP